jgi:prophage regulatory protein
MFNEAQESANMAHNILRIPEICRRTGECRSTLYNRIREGLWPKLIAIGPRLRGQPDYEVDQMIAARIAGRTTEEIQALVLRLVAARKSADQGEEKRPMVSSPGRQPAPDLVGRPA